MSKSNQRGYGKPPSHSQFKKGQSGNPKGRPKGSKNTKTIINEISGRKVKLKINGKERTVSQKEALWETLYIKALKGPVRDQMKLIEFLEKHMPDEDDGPIHVTEIRLVGVSAEDVKREKEDK